MDIKDLYEEYKEDTDIFTDEPDKVRKLKSIIFNDLNEVDRRIILLYAELDTLRNVAKVLGVGASTIFYKVRDIREKIKEKYDKIKDDID